jgi:hypothetical protein
VLRSTPRLFMLVVSTVTFALGLIALVLETSLAFQNFARELSSSNGSLWSTHRTNVVVAVCATITYLVVSVATLHSSFFLEKQNLIIYVRLFSFYSPTSSVRGGRPRCGIMIGGSLRSSHSSSSELSVSPHLSHIALAIKHEQFFYTNYVSTAAGGVDLGLYLHTIFNSSDQVLQEGTGVRQGDARAAILIGPTLATNLVSTLLIGIQAW